MINHFKLLKLKDFKNLSITQISDITLFPGMRSKWSEDEEDKVKISAGNGASAKKRSDSNTQEFPYPNAVDPKDGKNCYFYMLIEIYLHVCKNQIYALN